LADVDVPIFKNKLTPNMDNSYRYATLQILVVPRPMGEPEPMLEPWQDSKFFFGLLLKHHEAILS
jgi:hypothetical protein